MTNDGVLLAAPARTALLEGCFSTWLELGNSDPKDWSGADPHSQSCFRIVLGSGTKEDVARLEHGARGGHDLCEETRVFLNAFRYLGGGDADEESLLEELCKLSFSGNPRAQKLLAGISYMLTDGVSRTPMLSPEQSALSASKFFIEQGELRKAADVLFSGGWGIPGSYLVAFLILSESGFPTQGLTAIQMGAGLNDPACSGHIASIMLHGSGVNYENFKRASRAAERGFPMPLASTALALLDGAGIDRDESLAGVYWSLAKRAGYNSEKSVILGKIDLSARGLKPANPRDCFDIAKSWAGKHPTDPVFSISSSLWKGMQSKPVWI